MGSGDLGKHRTGRAIHVCLLKILVRGELPDRRLLKISYHGKADDSIFLHESTREWCVCLKHIFSVFFIT